MEVKLEAVYNPEYSISISNAPKLNVKGVRIMQSQKTIKINVRCIPNSTIALSDVLFIAKENVVHSHPRVTKL